MTFTGVSVDEYMLTDGLPIPPWLLKPQHMTFPVLESAHVKSYFAEAATSTMLDKTPLPPTPTTVTGVVLEFCVPLPN
jgi:hypothetical protein